MKQHDAAGPQERDMSSEYEWLAKEVAGLKREIEDIKARLSRESSLRVATDASVAHAVGSISEFIRGEKTAAADPE
ncbi:hypothetical protein PSCICL_47210 [Pseudomonas cichorii]|nr:hypothetical protein PSCICL_47210 [Pseudomonas cichorii]